MVAWSSSVSVSCFKVQSSIGHLVWFFDSENSLVSEWNSWCPYNQYNQIIEEEKKLRIYAFDTHTKVEQYPALHRICNFKNSIITTWPEWKDTNVIFSPKFCHTGEKRHFQSYDSSDRPLMAGDLRPLQRGNTFFTFALTFCGKPPSYYTKSCQLAFHLQRWRTISESQKLLHRNWPREGWR